MGRFSELETFLNGHAWRCALNDGDAVRWCAAVARRYGADAGTWFAGRVAFYRENIDAWKREEASYDPDLILGYHTNFSSEARYVVDTHDNDDEA